MPLSTKLAVPDLTACGACWAAVRVPLRRPQAAEADDPGLSAAWKEPLVSTSFRRERCWGEKHSTAPRIAAPGVPNSAFTMTATGR